VDIVKYVNCRLLVSQENLNWRKEMKTRIITRKAKKKLKNKGVFNIKPGMKVALTSPRK
jgi:hypothetical protein